MQTLKLIVLWLLLVQTPFERELKRQSKDAIIISATTAPISALIVKLYCLDSKIGRWEPCSDAGNLNPDEKGNLTRIFKGVLEDGTEFAIAPLGKSYK